MSLFNSYLFNAYQICRLYQIPLLFIMVGIPNNYRRPLTQLFAYTFWHVSYAISKVKVKHARYSPRVAQRFQEVKVPRFHDNGTGRL